MVKINVIIPEAINFNITDSKILLKYKNESVSVKIPKNIEYKIIGNSIDFRTSDHVLLKRFYIFLEGYFSTLMTPCKIVVLSNIPGSKFLEHNNNFYCRGGQSHYLSLPTVNGCSYSILSPTSIMISSVCKHSATNLAARICAFRKPDSYKGKGFFIEGQTPKARKTIKK